MVENLIIKSSNHSSKAMLTSLHYLLPTPGDIVCLSARMLTDTIWYFDSEAITSHNDAIKRRNGIKSQSSILENISSALWKWRHFKAGKILCRGRLRPESRHLEMISDMLMPPQLSEAALPSGHQRMSMGIAINQSFKKMQVRIFRYRRAASKKWRLSAFASLANRRENVYCDAGRPSMATRRSHGASSFAELLRWYSCDDHRNERAGEAISAINMPDNDYLSYALRGEITWPALYFHRQLTSTAINSLFNDSADQFI